MSQQFTTEIPVKTGLSPFNPSTGLGTNFWHCTTVPTAQYRSSSSWAPTKAEEKLIMKTTMKHYLTTLSDNAAKPFLDVNRKGFLLRKDAVEQKWLSGNRIAVLVLVYNGYGKPPVKDVDSYQRVWLPADHESGKRWWWTKVVLQHASEKDSDKAPERSRFMHLMQSMADQPSVLLD